MDKTKLLEIHKSLEKYYSNDKLVYSVGLGKRNNAFALIVRADKTKVLPKDFFGVPVFKQRV